MSTDFDKLVAHEVQCIRQLEEVRATELALMDEVWTSQATQAIAETATMLSEWMELPQNQLKITQYTRENSPPSGAPGLTCRGRIKTGKYVFEVCSMDFIQHEEWQTRTVLFAHTGKVIFDKRSLARYVAEQQLKGK